VAAAQDSVPNDHTDRPQQKIAIRQEPIRGAIQAQTGPESVRFPYDDGPVDASLSQVAWSTTCCFQVE
jgi:hypothetical protein